MARHASSGVRTIVVRPMSAPRSHSRALAPYRPAPVIIRQSRGSAIRHKVKHHARRVASGAFEQRHTIGAVVGGFVLGMIDKAGIDLPTLPWLGKAGTLGAAAWAMGKYGKNKWAAHAATGLLSIAAYELAKEGKINGPGLDGYIAGY